MTELLTDEIAFPLGRIVIAVADGKLVSLDFDDCAERRLALLHKRFGEPVFRHSDDPAGISSRLRAYFEGDLTAIDGIDVEPGGTPFQRAAWQALREIPVGQTASYGEQAARLGKPKASRAVGMANNRNPIAIVIPCHRVIGSDGSLTGYAGGLERKQWFLRHEGAVLL